MGYLSQFRCISSGKDVIEGAANSICMKKTGNLRIPIFEL